MVNKADKNIARLRRHRRVRGKISGTAERPRLDVFRSAKHIYAQVIDDVQGVGYRAAKQGNKLTLTLGFSHPVEFEETDTIKIELKDALHFSIVGIDKQEVGQYAAEVRGKRPPEPYKGKGIRYVGEYVIRKEGKAGKGK